MIFYKANQKHTFMEEETNRRMDGWMNEWMDGGMDGWLDGWLDEWVNV